MKYCKRHGKELKNYEECKVEECFLCKMEGVVNEAL